MSYKIKYIKIISVALLIFIVVSCKTTQKLYLQDVEVIAPINQSPIHITDSSSASPVVLSLRFSYNPQNEIKAQTDGTPPVNSQGFFQVDTFYNNDGTITYRKTPGANIYPLEYQNLTWEFGRVTVGFDVDIKLTRNLALFTGASYSGSSNKSTWGGTAGLGLFGEGNGMAFRLDAGIYLQSINYDAYTIAEITESNPFGPSEEYVIFYHDTDNSAHFDPFVNFTYNTAKRDWLLNFFINGGYSVQTLLNFDPKTVDYDWYFFPPFVYHTTTTYDFRGETTAGFVHFTPGIYFNITEKSRLILGVRFYFETQLKDATKQTFILPLMQVDFSF
jgi:hypothetical protein